MSLKETSISGSARPQTDLALAKCLAQPKAVAGALRKHAPDSVLVVFETGPRATFHRCLVAEGLPAGGIDARQAKAALATAQNKTGAIRRRWRSNRFASDGRGLALLGPDGVLPQGPGEEFCGDAGGAIALEHDPKKLLDFFDKDMLQLFESERFLFDHVIPRDREAL